MNKNKKLNRLNVLILGGLGFIGSNIVTELLFRKSFNIYIFDYPGIPNPFGDLIKLVYGDFTNEKELEFLFKENRIDIVIHLISTTVPKTSNDNIIYDINANLISTIKLLNIIVKYKVDKIIFFSSGGTIYGLNDGHKIDETCPTNPVSSYGIIKLAIEKYIVSYNYLYGLDYLILRVGNPYGPFHKSKKQGIINIFLKKILDSEPIFIWGNGANIRDYIYVGDLSSILFHLISNGVNNEIINLSTGVGYSINEILDILKIQTKEFKVEYTLSNKLDIPIIVLDISKLESKVKVNFTSIEDGIQLTYRSLLKAEKKLF
jgi:UDP-glucose 4-epimerase